MIDVDEALSLVLEHAQPLAPALVPLREALGCMLAEDAKSDIDSPPHDKALMDGYAVRAADVAPGRELAILEEVTAGLVPQFPVNPGQATRIMTGAPLPKGADAVVMVEQTELVEISVTPHVRMLAERLAPGANVLRQATVMRRGDMVIERGTALRAIEVGLLAEMGCGRAWVTPRPRVAVLATGDELVDVSQTPGPGQIRNSNSLMLSGMAREAGAESFDLGVARDNLSDLDEKISAGLCHHVLLMSGGVSAGVLDLAPQALTLAGVRQIFHKVRLKPGKPVWFGIHEHGPDRTLVFGLPGNPASCLVCFEVFVRPALARLAGRDSISSALTEAALTQAFTHRGDRPTYFPAKLSKTGDGWKATPLAWKGSADLRTLSHANGLIHFPAGDRVFTEGEAVPTRLFVGTDG